MLQSEIMELRADDKEPGEGLVLDCHVEKGLGTVLNVLIRWGQLRVGDFIVVGRHYGRVRKILDSSGQAVDVALPSMPVRVLGLKDFPAPGDDLITVADEEKAKKICDLRSAVAEKQRMEEAEEVGW